LSIPISILYSPGSGVGFAGASKRPVEPLLYGARGDKKLPKSYVIATIQITDASRYDKYRALASEAIAAHRGRVLVRGGHNEVMEGSAPGRTVVIEFDSLEQARRFYSSLEYTKARAAREGAADLNWFVVQGIDD
jgi:uncharacterized protein (DUF1330 family)